jgi:hypothetical protein
MTFTSQEAEEEKMKTAGAGRGDIFGLEAEPR